MGDRFGETAESIFHSSAQGSQLGRGGGGDRVLEGGSSLTYLIGDVLDNVLQVVSNRRGVALYFVQGRFQGASHIEKRQYILGDSIYKSVNLLFTVDNGDVGLLRRIRDPLVDFSRDRARKRLDVVLQLLSLELRCLGIVAEKRRGERDS